MNRTPAWAWIFIGIMLVLGIATVAGLPTPALNRPGLIGIAGVLLAIGLVVWRWVRSGSVPPMEAIGAIVVTTVSVHSAAAAGPEWADLTVFIALPIALIAAIVWRFTGRDAKRPA